METNKLDTVLKQTLTEEIAPSVKLDMETQRKMRKVAQKQEFYLINLLSIVSIGFLVLGMIIILPKIQIQPFKILYIILNINIFTLFIFFPVINKKNRKELVL